MKHDPKSKSPDGKREVPKKLDSKAVEAYLRILGTGGEECKPLIDEANKLKSNTDSEQLRVFAEVSNSHIDMQKEAADAHELKVKEAEQRHAELVKAAEQSFGTGKSEEIDGLHRNGIERAKRLTTDVTETQKRLREYEELIEQAIPNQDHPTSSNPESVEAAYAAGVVIESYLSRMDDEKKKEAEKLRESVKGQHTLICQHFEAELVSAKQKLEKELEDEKKRLQAEYGAAQQEIDSGFHKKVERLSGRVVEEEPVAVEATPAPKPEPAQVLEPAAQAPQPVVAPAPAQEPTPAPAPSREASGEVLIQPDEEAVLRGERQKLPPEVRPQAPVEALTPAPAPAPVAGQAPAEAELTTCAAYYELARKHIFSGDVDKAIDALNNAIKLNPTNDERIDCDLLAAECYSRRGDFVTARDILNSAIKLNPNSDRVLLKLAETCMKVGEYEEAVSHYTRLIELQKERPVAATYVVRGDAYEKAGQLEKAEADYKVARRINPNDRDADKRWLAVVDKLDELALSKAQLPAEAAARVAPSISEEERREEERKKKESYYYKLMSDVTYALQSKNYEGARVRGEEALKLREHLSEQKTVHVLYYYLAQAYVGTKKYTAALECIGEAIKNNPELAYVAYRAVCNYYFGKYEEAAKDINKDTAQFVPRRIRMLNKVYLNYERSKAYIKEKKAAVAKNIETRRGTSATALSQGNQLYEVREYEYATEYYSNTIRTNPLLFAAYRKLAVCHWKTSKTRIRLIGMNDKWANWRKMRKEKAKKPAAAQAVPAAGTTSGAQAQAQTGQLPEEVRNALKSGGAQTLKELRELAVHSPNEQIALAALNELDKLDALEDVKNVVYAGNRSVRNAVIAILERRNDVETLGREVYNDGVMNEAIAALGRLAVKGNKEAMGRMEVTAEYCTDEKRKSAAAAELARLKASGRAAPQTGAAQGGAVAGTPASAQEASLGPAPRQTTVNLAASGESPAASAAPPKAEKRKTSAVVWDAVAAVGDKVNAMPTWAKRSVIAGAVTLAAVAGSLYYMQSSSSKQVETKPPIVEEAAPTPKAVPEPTQAPAQNMQLQLPVREAQPMTVQGNAISTGTTGVQAPAATAVSLDSMTEVTEGSLKSEPAQAPEPAAPAPKPEPAAQAPEPAAPAKAPSGDITEAEGGSLTPKPVLAPRPAKKAAKRPTSARRKQILPPDRFSDISDDN